MAEGREHAEHARIADEDVEAAVALVECGTQAVDLIEILEIERHEGCRAACGLDRVVHLLETADRAGDEDDVGALRGEALGDRGTQAARGAGDERDTPSECRHAQTISARSESCGVFSPPW